MLDEPGSMLDVVPATVFFREGGFKFAGGGGGENEGGDIESSCNQGAIAPSLAALFIPPAPYPAPIPSRPNCNPSPPEPGVLGPLIPNPAPIIVDPALPFFPGMTDTAP